MRSKFNYTAFSDDTKIEALESGKIQLKEYTNDLILYSNFDSTTNATYALSNINATVGNNVSIENFGVFAQHVLIGDSGYLKYDTTNFVALTDEGSLKFRLRAGFNKGYSYQEFNATTSPTISGDTYYGFKLYSDVTLISGDSIFVLLETGDSLINISTKINTELTTYDVSSSVTSSKLRITSLSLGDSISITASTTGRSLLTLLSGVGSPISPNAPSVNTEFIRLGKSSGEANRISLIHTTTSHLILAINDNDGDTITYSDLGIWSNNYNTWYAFELDWNSSIVQLYINGIMKTVASTGFARLSTDTQIKLQSTVGNPYRFDELIIYNTYKNTKNYTVETVALPKYATDNPYVDVYFGNGFTEGNVIDLNATCHADCRFVVKIGNTWYYYLAGSWRVSDGSYSQGVTPGVIETQFANLLFNEEADIIIRVYLHSDGTYQTYLEDLEIETRQGEAEPATITGTVSLQYPVNLTTNYNVLITTNSGSSTVDTASAAADRSTVTMAEIKTSIDNAAVPGLDSVTDDGSYHLVLTSSASGEDSRVAIASATTNDALSLVWGYAADSSGEDAGDSVIDYSELFRYVRSMLGEPIMPAEITDEQLEDCLSDAIYHYNRWRNFKEELYFINLNGTPQSGYTIPAIVGGQDNIVEIIVRPRFPFTYYAGRTDLMSNLYVTALFQRYTSGFTQMLTDYYLTISLEEDINIILGNQFSWEILNNKIFLHPEPRDLFVGIRYRAALSASEIVTDYWIRKLVLAEAKVVLGNIRSTFKSGIPGGNEMLQLNGEELKAEGKEEFDKIIEEMKKSAEPTFLIWG